MKLKNMKGYSFKKRYLAVQIFSFFSESTAGNKFLFIKKAHEQTDFDKHPFDSRWILFSLLLR